jgi:hypothetical protein
VEFSKELKKQLKKVYQEELGKLKDNYNYVTYAGNG